MANDDVALIQRILLGDETAFANLVKRYQKQVHAHAWRKTGDFHIAEDITQETFLRVYQKLETLEEPEQFQGWLHKIVNHLCIAWFRKNRIIQPELLEEIDISVTETEAYSRYVAAEHAKTTAQTHRDLVKKLLTKLKEREQEVITLHYFEEMTSSEIGTYLGISENTVKSRIRRARQRLKTYEFMIREALDITIEGEHRSQHQVKGAISMTRDDTQIEGKPEEKQRNLNEEESSELWELMQTEVRELIKTEFRELMPSITAELSTRLTEDNRPRQPLTNLDEARDEAFKILTTLPADAENQIAWGYVGAYRRVDDAGPSSRIAFWRDSLDGFLAKAPDADIVNFATLFTNPTVVAVLRQLVTGEKAVEELAQESGISENEIEKAVALLIDSKLAARTEAKCIEPKNDVISFFLNFVSMTIVHLGHINPKD